MLLSDAILEQLKVFHPSSVKITGDDVLRHKIEMIHDVTDLKSLVTEPDYTEIAGEVQKTIDWKIPKEDKTLLAVLRAIKNTKAKLTASEEPYNTFDFYARHSSKDPKYVLALYTQESGLGVTVIINKSPDLKKINGKLLKGESLEKHYLINSENGCPTDEKIQKMLEEDSDIVDLNDMDFEKAREHIRADSRMGDKFNEIVSKYEKPFVDGDLVPSKTGYLMNLLELYTEIFGQSPDEIYKSTSPRIDHLKSKIKTKLGADGKLSNLYLNAKLKNSISLNIGTKEQIIYSPVKTPISVKSYNEMLANMEEILPLLD